MPNSSTQRLRRLLLANSLGLLLGVAVFTGLEWDDGRWVGSLAPQALPVSEPYLRQARTEVQQTGVRTWLILYHEVNAPCSAFSAVGWHCAEASPLLRDAAVCMQFNRWRHLEWVMTETAPTPLTVDSAKCHRRDLGSYLWTELLPFLYYAPPIGCRFAWASGCLVPDPDHPAPVTP